MSMAKNTGGGRKRYIMLATIIAAIFAISWLGLDYAKIKITEDGLLYYASSIFQAYAAIAGVSVALMIFAIMRTRSDNNAYEGLLREEMPHKDIVVEILDEHDIISDFSDIKKKILFSLISINHYKDYYGIEKKLKKYQRYIIKSSSFLDYTLKTSTKILTAVFIVMIISISGFYDIGEDRNEIAKILTITVISSITYFLFLVVPLFQFWRLRVKSRLQA